MTSPADGRGGPVRLENETVQRKKRRRGLGGWFTSASGILASVATIVAAVASVLAAHQTARVDHLTIVVHQQLAQIKRAQQATRSRQPSGATTKSGDTGGASLQGSAYLSALQPTVDNGVFDPGSQVMSAKPYPDSVTFSCLPASGGQPTEAFDVAGHTLFTAVVGIPDDTSDVTGVDETVTFTNQSGTRLMNPVTVSLGRPATVRLNITGVTQLAVTCTGINTQTQQSTNGNAVTLGNAEIS
jgi:hypothetical protein